MQFRFLIVSLHYYPCIINVEFWFGNTQTCLNRFEKMLTVNVTKYNVHADLIDF